MSNIKSVKNQKGTLLRGTDGDLTFRVDLGGGKFKDYEVHNHDLEVIIVDEDAFFYEESETIDYSPETLGRY